MDSLITVLDALETKGFTTQFEVSHLKLLSLKTEKRFAPDQVKIIHFYRFEGESNPDDGAILYAIETNTYEKGTLVDGYGPTSDSTKADFMKQVANIQK
ncbi:hypothetical protein SAMN04487935_1958 [Flavobacterium noncentrifugens]|uniref:Phosphoribosylpyrophosphate synthetase n=2 Tax=Flavobacterium noncentrifugens TaxID=1128970 RepID=A0A1G8WV87_9FLAO|nr:hypothetical protein SAMN04487935_1958 [Flavobacterium noncentrifugens]